MPFWTEHNVFKNYLSRLLEYEEKNARRQEELRKELKEFMKAIQDFATTQTAVLIDISRLTAIAASVQGTTDPFTPSDQAALDAMAASMIAPADVTGSYRENYAKPGSRSLSLRFFASGGGF